MPLIWAFSNSVSGEWWAHVQRLVRTGVIVLLEKFTDERVLRRTDISLRVGLAGSDPAMLLFRGNGNSRKRDGPVLAFSGRPAVAMRFRRTGLSRALQDHKPCARRLCGHLEPLKRSVFFLDANCSSGFFRCADSDFN